jgi:hypothetical protein
VVLALALAGLLLAGCSADGDGAGLSVAAFEPACQPFDPDITHSCLIRLRTY